MKLEDIKKIIKEQIAPKSVLLDKPTVVTEANYNRVRTRIEEEMIPFVMITAFRGGFSKRDNLKRQKELESRVRDAGFSWTKMPGSGYLEDPEEEGGEPNQVKENSIIIWDAPRADVEVANEDLFQLGQMLAKEYSQDSFIFGKTVQDGEERELLIRAYDQAGDRIQAPWAGPWDKLSVIDSDDVYWSTIGSKKAKLTEMLELANAMKVNSREDAMKKQHALDAVRSALKRFE
jgi:hypothetical protein